MGFDPHGLITGIGSLPYISEETGVEKVLAALPLAPHWPQLPRKGVENSFLGQFIKPLVESGLIASYQQPYFCTTQPDWQKKGEEFLELCITVEKEKGARLERFGLPPHGRKVLELFCDTLKKRGTGAAQLVKGQMSGPVTLGLYIKDDQGRAAYQDETQRQMLVKTLAGHARWQTGKLRELGLPVLISIDEPGLFILKSKLNEKDRQREKIRLLADVNEVLNAIVVEAGIPAIHVCADTDWKWLFSTAAQVISFDALHYMDSMAEEAEGLEDFLHRRGVLMWGIIPTDKRAFSLNISDLYRFMDLSLEKLTKKGINRNMLLRQSMLSPVCGTGMLSDQLAERIYELLHQLSKEFMAT